MNQVEYRDEAGGDLETRLRSTLRDVPADPAERLCREAQILRAVMGG